MGQDTERAYSVTSDLANIVESAQYSDLPSVVQDHGLRAVVNFVGCALGGARHDIVDRIVHATEPHTGPSPVLGRSTCSTPTVSALLNGAAASVYTFDDTYAAAIVHPSAPVGGALVGVCGVVGKPVRGEDFLVAFCWGLELTCRIAKALSAPPAEGELGWSLTGVAGTVGAAAACAKLLALSPRETTHALGTAASLAGGARVAHGSMAMHLAPAQAGATGAQAALMARAGITGPANALEGRFGLLALFARKPAIEHLTSEVGKSFELIDIMFKAYPCGTVIHAAIDACLALHASPSLNANTIQHVEIEAPSITAALADRPQPSDEAEALVSVQHWAAVALLRGRAGLAEGQGAAVFDPEVRKIRARCALKVNTAISAVAARAQVTLIDGSVLRATVDHHLGSLDRPLDESSLSAKFLTQAEPLLGRQSASDMLQQCWNLRQACDVRHLWRRR